MNGGQVWAAYQKSKGDKVSKLAPDTDVEREALQLAEGHSEQVLRLAAVMRAAHNREKIKSGNL